MVKLSNLHTYILLLLSFHNIGLTKSENHTKLLAKSIKSQTKLCKGLYAPSGFLVAVTPDGQTLYSADVYRHAVYSIKVSDNSKIGRAHV